MIRARVQCRSLMARRGGGPVLRRRCNGRGGARRQSDGIGAICLFALMPPLVTGRTLNPICQCRGESWPRRVCLTKVVVRARKHGIKRARSTKPRRICIVDIAVLEKVRETRILAIWVMEQIASSCRNVGGTFIYAPINLS